MVQEYPNLGLCFFGNQLFYAVSRIGSPHEIARIGSFDFNIDVAEMLFNPEQHFQGLSQTVQQLKSEFGVQHLRILSFPTLECWSTMPKIAYDNAGEREKHISILMSGIERKDIQATWYNLSNQDYKLLLLRNEASLQGMRNLASGTSTIDLISDFEIGARWVQHANPGGSFMTVCCFQNCISVASFILGKLRGATYINFDDIQDLPYLWLQHAKKLSWMQGLHEEIYVYGIEAFRLIEILQPFWDEAGTVTKMDTLNNIQIEADEETYGFSLEQAFPAIMLALDYQ